MGYTTTEKIISVITDYKNSLYTLTLGKHPADIDQEQFVMLLSAAAACRKWPMLDNPMPFDKLYRCIHTDERVRTAEWLKKAYGVESWETLEATCRKHFSLNEEYRNFWAEWNNMTAFTAEKPDPASLFKLKRCNVYIRKFISIIGEGGIYAYDCTERIGLARLALACGIITDEQFWYTVIPYAKKASVLYDNWIEYGLSYLVGFLYHTYQQHNCSEEISPQFKVAFGITQYLFDNHWCGKGWYEFSTEYALDKSEMKQLIQWEGPDLCIATNRITVDHFPVGYMHRDPPDSNFNDSGWRFYQGTEDDEYAFDLNNSGMHSLNDICNYDPAVIPYLNSPAGTSLRRTPDGTFEIVEDDMA